MQGNGSEGTIVRLPAVAGTFYPADPTRLRGMVEGFLRQTVPPADDEPAPKAIIAPHAGYVYSGPVAASAYVRLRPLRECIERVVLLGPSHYVGFEGLAATSADVFQTPLGQIEIDRAAVESALRLPQVLLLDQAHLREHSLEVQLPFLQCVLERFRLVPFSVGNASPAEVAEVLDHLWGGPETLLVISSDLSHYYDYATARRMDAATSAAIEALDPAGLGRESACGRVPVGGLLVAARRHHLEARNVDLRNSGDTAGPRDEVVGYGAYVLA